MMDEDHYNDEMKQGIKQAFDACSMLVSSHLDKYTEEYQQKLVEILSELAAIKRKAGPQR